MVLGDIIDVIASDKLQKFLQHKLPKDRILELCKQTYVIQEIGFLAYMFQLLRSQLRPDKRCQLPI